MLDSHLIAKTKPLPNPAQIYITDKVRVTVIAPELLRVEVSDSFVFCDEATQIVWFRDLGEHPFNLEFQKDHVIATKKLNIIFTVKER